MGIFRQFPYSNFHELNLDWIINKIKDLSTEWLSIKDDIDTFYNAASEQLEELVTLTDQTIAEIEQYVNNYFEGTGIEEEIQEQLNILKEDGYFEHLLEQVIIQKTDVPCTMEYSNFFTNTEGGYPNGSCYIGNDLMAVYLCSGTYNTGRLVIINTESWVKISEITLELKHGNSLTYNPEESKIYAVSLYNIGSAAKLLNEVKIIDVSDLSNPSVVETKQLPMPQGSTGVYALVYNPVRKEFAATIKGGSTGSNNPGEVDRIVFYNEDLSAITRTVMINPSLTTPNQGVCLYQNDTVYMNFQNREYRLIATFNADTGKLTNAFNLPKYLNGYRYIGEFESLVYNPDNQKFIGVSASYGNGVTDRTALCIFEMGFYNPVIARDVFITEYTQSEIQNVTINVRNGREGVSTDIYTMYCIMDAINACVLHNLTGRIILSASDYYIGSMDICGFSGGIFGPSATSKAQYVGGIRVFNSNIKFTFSRFSGSASLENRTGNLMVMNSTIICQTCEFTSKAAIFQSTAFHWAPDSPIEAVQSIVTSTVALKNATLTQSVSLIEN